MKEIKQLELDKIYTLVDKYNHFKYILRVDLITDSKDEQIDFAGPILVLHDSKQNSEYAENLYIDYKNYDIHESNIDDTNLLYTYLGLENIKEEPEIIFPPISQELSNTKLAKFLNYG